MVTIGKSQALRMTRPGEYRFVLELRDNVSCAEARPKYGAEHRLYVRIYRYILVVMGPPSFFTAASAAWKPILEWVPSQNGLFTDAPQRHRATACLPVRSYLLPSASVSSSSLRSPETR